MGKYGTEWSAADSALAATLWREGQSAAQIAKQVGRSRNAVIGRLDRIGARGQARATGAQSQVRTGKVVNARLKAKAAVKPKGARQLPKATKQEARPAEFVGKDFAALEADECRWIEGEAANQVYCAAATAPGQSYCEHHRAMCFEPGTALGPRRSFAGYIARKERSGHYYAGFE